ncbi:MULTISPECIES: hypothetical protein [Bacillus cereus group]|uniref:hypothetical protein n=1 Tax=Bacillus cereus group TaxID=86661 RepID=UPI000BEC6B9E|nr:MULTISPECIES: hypothetical protein [Bacillus cereus group]PDZ19291.1 hypothetical protein CON41_30120 [Bacillus cereus]PFC56108.1 hypothetical protein CN282_03875 [Bacillus thuringiensis]
MTSCISVLDWYHNGDLSEEEFLSTLFDLAVVDYHPGVQKELTEPDITNDCIKVAQIGTFMKLKIKDFINKYLVSEVGSPNVMYFPIIVYSLNSEFEKESIFEKVQKGFLEDIYHILLGSIDSSDRDTFIFTCLNWEKTCFRVWEQRIKQVNADFEAVIENLK